MNRNLILFIYLFAYSLLPTLAQVQNYQSINASDKFDIGNWYAGNQNFVEFSYGFGELNHKNVLAPFEPNILTEIKLGKRYLKPAANYKLLSFEDNYLISSYVRDNLKDVEKPLNTNYEIWRFGVGLRKGYGYSFGSFAIFPSYQLSLIWNQSKFKVPNLDYYLSETNQHFPNSDIALVKKYNNAVKFGTSNVAGIDFKISSFLNVGAEYETQVIFPHYLFWKQLGSFFIETLSQTGIDFFTEGVLIKEAPQIAPVLYFILKNGLSYFLFTLKQDEMNWPFETKAPLTLESIKVSLKLNL